LYEIKESTKPNGKARIIVVGIGGAGNNVVDRMIEDGVTGVEFVAMNTDLQDLELSLATNKVPLGEKETQGLGAGADPEVGERAAQESIDDIREHIKNAATVSGKFGVQRLSERIVVHSQCPVLEFPRGNLENLESTRKIKRTSKKRFVTNRFQYILQGL
jgi:hypothetical protein